MSVSGFQIFKKLVRPLLGRGLGRYRLISRLYRYLFDRLRPTGLVLLSIQGQKMYIDTADTSLSPSLLMSDIWEPGTTKLFRALLKPGMVVIDVGANIGYYSLISAQLVGAAGHVYAIEPVPSNFSVLQRNIELNHYTNITVIPKAVSDHRGVESIVLHPTGSGAHHLQTAGQETGGEINTVMVEVCTLDELLIPSVSKVDLVKIDVEGFEPAVVNGMSELIHTFPKLMMIIEFTPWCIERAGYSPPLFLNELSNMGFRLGMIDDKTGDLREFNRERLYDPNVSSNLFCVR